MKLNIAFPKNGSVKQFLVSDETLRRVHLTDYRLGQEVDGAIFGEPFKGYTFRLKGGSDKDGFPMVNGVMAFSRVSLLIKRGSIGFNTFRGRSGERRRKSLRGCILSNDIACLNVVIVKRGEQEIDGVTDVSYPRRLGPKRASNIKKTFHLDREMDVRKFVVRRKVTKEGKKDRYKTPKIQRLITSTVRARRQKKMSDSIKKVQQSAEQRKNYLALLSHQRVAQRQRKHSRASRVRAVLDQLDQTAFAKVKETTKPTVAPTGAARKVAAPPSKVAAKVVAAKK